MPRLCAFCPGNAVETGGEHVWDDWINKALPKGLTYRARKRSSLDSPVVEFTAHKLNAKLSVVCTECNNGWMSVLTNKVRERFGKSILEGEPFSLGPKDAILLAAFTFMKAIATDYSHAGEPFFTRAARERFAISLIQGMSIALPSFKAWCAAFHGTALMSTRNDLRVVGTQEPGPLYGIEFLSFTYVVGKLALQLLAPRWKDIRRRGRPLQSLRPHPDWEQATIQFWPSNGTILSWPPSKYLGDGTIQGFIQRLGNRVEVPIA